VDSVSEIGADWVIASQDCFGRFCNPVTCKYHSIQRSLSRLLMSFFLSTAVIHANMLQLLLQTHWRQWK